MSSGRPTAANCRAEGGGVVRCRGVSQVRALWIMGTNPAVSLPDSNRVRQALSRCELLVVSDGVASNDTLNFARVKLPAQTWGEKSGTVTNSGHRITAARLSRCPGRRSQLVGPVSGGRRLGYHGFDFEQPAEIFDEHARLSAYQNNGARDFDLSGLVNWRRRITPIAAGTVALYNRLFADGRFSPGSQPAWSRWSRTHRPCCFILVLNTGRVRDHWHTMTHRQVAAPVGAYQRAVHQPASR